MSQTPSEGIYVAFGASGMGMGGGRQGGQMPNEGARPQGNRDELPEWAEGEAPERPERTAGEMPNGEAAAERPELPENGAFGEANAAEDASKLRLVQENTLEIRDAEGNVLFTAQAEKTAESVVFCAETLAAGEHYSLYIDATLALTAAAEEGSGTSEVQMPAGGFDESGAPPEGEALETAASDDGFPMWGFAAIAAAALVLIGSVIMVRRKKPETDNADSSAE